MRVNVYVTAEKYEFQIDDLNRVRALRKSPTESERRQGSTGRQRLPLPGAHGRRGTDETAPGPARLMAVRLHCKIYLGGKRRFVRCSLVRGRGGAPRPERKNALGGKDDDSEG